MSSPQFKVKAVYEYTSPHEEDLHFPLGQIITVITEEDDDWYSGEYVDASGVRQEGIFPKNFVEKYEPPAPPRPTRPNRPKKEEPAPEPVIEPEPMPTVEPVHEPVHEPVPEPEPQRIQEPPAPVAREPPLIPKPQAEVPQPSAPKPIPSSSKPSAPPPVSQKPSGGSFRDRIAAFNKAAPPVAPFKPGGLSSGGSNNFIRKPFVAPPPSKNAYVPVPREPPPQKIYRREEDPEIAAKETENQELAERAGLAPTSNGNAEEEQPKPTSLKERIALLQKQQMEQAARHADAAQKKEKPKRPAKKRIESHDQPEVVEEGDGVSLERQDTGETAGKHSIDSTREPRRRKSSKGAYDAGSHLRESFGDGNDADMSGAGDTTEEPEEISTGRDSDEKPRRASMLPPPRAPAAPIREPDVGEEEGASEEEAPAPEEDEEEEEDDIDPEVRRKEELRARMAKMSGGMGMHGMFGPPGGMPPMPPPKKKKPAPPPERRTGDYEEVVSPPAPPIPMIPMPGISRVRSPEEVNNQLEEEETTPISTIRPADEVPDVEDIVPSQERSAPPPLPTHESAAPPIPGGRPAPPPVPKESRPSVPAPMSPSAGSESDDELSVSAQNLATTEPAEVPRQPLRPVESPTSPKSPNSKRVSYFGSDHVSPTSPTTPGNKRMSRLPPPIPGAAPLVQNRAPPPPPPAVPLSRSPTSDQHAHPSISESVPQDDEEEVTEYEGDYDTDIASAAPHKDALKAHAREPSFDDTLSILSPVTSPTIAPPPLPPTGPPRGVPPPLPSQPPPASRHSTDILRAAPRPPPSKVPAPWEQQDDEYDPYNYSASPLPGASLGSPPLKVEGNEDDLYSASPPRTFTAPVNGRPAPTTPGREAPMLSSGRAPPRQSFDVSRSANTNRRSVELGRMSMDSGFVANDVDLARSSFWWTQPKGRPPIFQGRKDILFESEESSVQRSSKTIVTKELYVLYQDYSQTIITARFDAQNPSDVKLEQRHEQPPARLRQDQLEQAHEQFGRRISEAVVSRKETIVGDGTPQGLIQELLKPLTNALLPIGTRGYGAVIYSNLANASTQQNDEIRPGDIITLRNTKFQGKHGPMHAKYSIEVGKPDHVGIVAEWDGTKKKVRAWEQGRESKKVKMESFKLDDLRSGEVKIWRVMPRSWVGWSGGN